jgi:hypothetical protein
LFVKPRPVHSSQCFAHRIQTPGSTKRNSHISQARARVALCPASSSRLARLVVALGAIRFACTDRQRASAGPQSRAATPPSARAAQTHQIAVAELQRRHRFAERQLKFVARIRAPEHAGRCDCASACCSSAVSQPCVSLVVRGVGQRSSERHRRAADKRLLLRSSGSLGAPAGAHRRQRARVAHTGLSVLSRCCWCWCARCAEERSGSPLDVKARVAALWAHWHTTATRIAAHVRRAVRASLFLQYDD